MSSGQRAMYDEEEDAYLNRIVEKLQSTPVSEVVKIILAINENVMFLEKSIDSLPRSGWSRLDALKNEIRKLL